MRSNEYREKKKKEVKRLQFDLHSSLVLNEENNCETTGRSTLVYS